MYTVDEVASRLKVSKVTIYAKLKKYESEIVIKQGKKYITDELFKLIKEDLKNGTYFKKQYNYDYKPFEHELDNSQKNSYEEKFTDNTKVSLELINILRHQIEEKDRQLAEKDKQIEELINLNKNNQILLKQNQDKEINQLMLEDRVKSMDEKIVDLKEKMDFKINSKKSFFRLFNRENN